MSDILLVTSSALGEHSMSRRIALSLINATTTANPNLNVVTRDVSGLVPISLTSLSALRTEAADRSPEQQAAALFSDAIIEEVEAASIVVITAPMYAFTIPATLKTWIEYLNRPGRAYHHGKDGDEGLLINKKVVVVATRGSSFADDAPMNYQQNYLEAVLNFFGMTDVTFIVAEGTAADTGKAAIAAAETRAAELGERIAKP